MIVEASNPLHYLRRFAECHAVNPNGENGPACMFSGLKINGIHNMSSKRIIAGLSLAILSGTVLLHGQDQPAPAIVTDRPAVTDSSIVVPSGNLVVENGFAEIASDGQRGFDFPETLARFGLTSKTELRFNPPDYFNNYNSGTRFGSGWGDLSLGVKQQLVAKSSFDASLIVALSFPTGANAVSSHGYDPQMLLPWSHPLSTNWTAAGMFALFWPTQISLTQGAARNLTGQASFLLDRQITSRWDTFTEYAGDFPQRGGPQHLLHIGTAFKITPNQQLDFHIGFGLSSAAVDHFVGFGYSFQVQAIRREKRN
jgi:Putative MetA-pathway of phenol degradation